MLKKKKGITLRLELAAETEKRLREYVKREFKCSLEHKLNEVLIGWIGKALEHIQGAISV